MEGQPHYITVLISVLQHPAVCCCNLHASWRRDFVFAVYDLSLKMSAIFFIHIFLTAAHLCACCPRCCRYCGAYQLQTLRSYSFITITSYIKHFRIHFEIILAWRLVERFTGMQELNKMVYFFYLMSRQYYCTTLLFTLLQRQNVIVQISNYYHTVM